MVGAHGEGTEQKKGGCVSAALPKSHHAALAQKPSSVSNIVLPLDGSELSRMAIPVVRGLTELYAATPHLAYAGEQPVEPEARLAHLGVKWGDLPGAVIDQAGGLAPQAILALAKELPRCLIAMCTHTGHSSRDPDYFGSVTESVLAGKPERIVLVAPERGGRDFTISRIVIAHDGTPSADCAIGPAAEIALRARADIIVLHVAAPRAGCPERTGSLPAPQYIDQPQHEWPSWSNEFGARMLALGAPAPSVKFKLVVTGGQPGSEIAQLVRGKKGDMVVMASPAEWKAGKPNAARVVIQTSGCPVLLVRTGELASNAPGPRDGYEER
jgi:nucleotide-binding universal stress UspA family protein